MAKAINAVSRVPEMILNEVGGEESAKVLFREKIVAVERRVSKGHSYGSITVAGLCQSE